MCRKSLLRREFLIFVHQALRMLGSTYMAVRDSDSAKTLDQLFQRIHSILAAAGLSEEEMLATLPAARARVYKRLYGKPTREKTATKQAGRGNNQPV